MVTETRWFLCKLAFASMVSWHPTSAGYLPGVAPDIPLTGGQPPAGMILAHVPAHVLGLSLCAVTFDKAIANQADIDATWNALELAPDARVFDMRENLDRPQNAWARSAAFEARLESKLIDIGRFQGPTRTIRAYLREVARTLLFYRFLGRFHWPVALDQTLAVVDAVGLEALRNHLAEHGFPLAKLPRATTTFRSFFRLALADPFASYGLEDVGGFRLGHVDAHLRGA